MLGLVALVFGLSRVVAPGATWPRYSIWLLALWVAALFTRRRQARSNAAHHKPGRANFPGLPSPAGTRDLPRFTSVTKELPIVLRLAIEDLQRERPNLKPDAALNILSENQTRFLLKLDAVLLVHIHKTGYGATDLAQDMAMSARSFRRHIHALLGVTPNRALGLFRLARAAELLQKGMGNKRVIQRVGFNSVSYFCRCFKAEFGMTPQALRMALWRYKPE